MGKSRRGNLIPSGIPTSHHFEHTRISQVNEKSSIIKPNGDGQEEEKNNKILEKIFQATGSDVKKLRKFGRNVFLENAKSEISFCKKIDSYIKKVENENFASKENNSNDYELVEKSSLDKLVYENNDLMKAIRDLEDKLTNIKKFNFKCVSEENFLKHAVENNKKSPYDNNTKMSSLVNETAKANILNKNLKTVLANEKIKYNNILQALRTLITKFDKDICDEFEELVKKYDNFYFIYKKKYINDSEIEALLGKVNQLENLKFSKEVEIKNLKNSKPEKLHLFKK